MKLTRAEREVLARALATTYFNSFIYVLRPDEQPEALLQLASKIGLKRDYLDAIEDIKAGVDGLDTRQMVEYVVVAEHDPEKLQ